MSDARQLTDHERDLYARNILVPEIGEKGQVTLLGSRVLVVGAGGLGSPALLYLAAAGVGRLGIADGDRVEVSNLQRQVLHGYRDVGRLKTESAREALGGIRPDLEIETFSFRLDPCSGPEIISGFDFVVDASDSFSSKFLVNDACLRADRPFSHAGIRGLYGQTMTVLPGQSPCLRCLFQDVPEEKAKGAGGEENGVLGCAAGVIGAIQALEAVKYLVGAGELLAGRVLTFDAAIMRFRIVELPVDKRCDACRAV